MFQFQLQFQLYIFSLIIFSFASSAQHTTPHHTTTHAQQQQHQLQQQKVPGQYYKDHHDESGDVHDEQYNVDGPRVLTFFLYLNDVEEGGETQFTNIFGDDTDIYLNVKPKRGRALLWPSMLNEDLLAYDVRTYHAALEVKKGFKYGANAWLHLRNYRTNDCDTEALEKLKADKLLFPQ